MDELQKCYYNSPIGSMEILVGRNGISGLSFLEKEIPTNSGNSLVIENCSDQLDEYFKGKRREFTLPLDLNQGSTFRRTVWSALLDIPCGETRSYGGLANDIGNRAAARAVGGACHANPLVLVVPCHRVLGTTGKLTGFGAGIWRKEWLLKHEKIEK